MNRKYGTHFEMNPSDIDLVEGALRAQASALSRDLVNDPKQAPSLASYQKDTRHARVMQIQQLLAKLHDRKIWYKPKHFVPRG
jgi:hypothetical protein